MAASKLVLMMVFMAVAAIHFQPTVAQTRHVVGDALGWTIPPANAYTTWASRQNFTVGDTLFFNFTTNLHDVAEVREAAYGPCTTANPISLTTAGPATLNLTTAGAHYYICTVSTHCQIGQKLTINVAAATSGPPSSSTPSPAPPSSSTPAPAGSTMPPPSPPSNASPSLTTVVPFTFLAGALAALFY